MYCTTENFQEDNKVRGQIHFLPPIQGSSSKHLAFCDIFVNNIAGESMLLERVDIDKIRSCLKEAEKGQYE